MDVSHLKLGLLIYFFLVLVKCVTQKVTIHMAAYTQSGSMLFKTLTFLMCLYIQTYALDILIAKDAGVWHLTTLFSCLLRKKDSFYVLTYLYKQSIANGISSFPCISREILWDMKPVYFLSSFLYWLRLPFSTRLLYSSNCR